MVDAFQAERYLREYVSQYRRQYEQFTNSRPSGAGYPKLRVSPYLGDTSISCYLATNGAVIIDSSEPQYDWQKLGGVTTLAVARADVPSVFAEGMLGKPASARKFDSDSLHLEIERHRYDLTELLQRLTFSTLLGAVDLKLPSESSDFWLPTIVRDIGFISPYQSTSRFFHYCEILSHADKAAWDERSAWVRAHNDLRRDFAAEAARPPSGGSISFLRGALLPERFRDRLAALQEAADGLEGLLNSSPNAPESAFHEYLRSHSILLDVYGIAVSKPRLEYPPGEAPQNKTYVEPDFIIKYWDRTYMLVELERPDHPMETVSGRPRAEVTQPAFQIAEWKDYLDHHYELVKSQFPDITGNNTSMIVMSRDWKRRSGQAPKDRYFAVLRKTYNVDHIYTYDDIVRRAREAIRQLDSLGDALSRG